MFVANIVRGLDISHIIIMSHKQEKEVEDCVTVAAWGIAFHGRTRVGDRSFTSGGTTGTNIEETISSLADRATRIRRSSAIWIPLNLSLHYSNANIQPRVAIDFIKWSNTATTLPRVYQLLPDSDPSYSYREGIKFTTMPATIPCQIAEIDIYS